MPDGVDELNNLLLAAFKRAMADERTDVAEHLLLALELLGEQAERGEQPPDESAVAKAYRMITKLPKRPSR